ncbi:non-specific lipid-transfer protein 1-like [Andrographis paniculata]|uniref:non-specific lipid-transfer protein 1-like n=1 Tax=Andrographis paniculata TaxID=175694 RepID=UPI0021E7BF29|nr:non-specific lipid-transfer protein 1-like [Andrographis paniculata]
MAKSSSSALQIWLVAAVAVVAVLGSSRYMADGAITCNAVLAKLSPCLGYIRSGGAAPPAGCCDGAKALNSAAATTPDRQAACGCIKNLAAATGAKPELINSIPGKCQVNIPYRFSSTIDCSKIR